MKASGTAGDGSAALLLRGMRLAREARVFPHTAKAVRAWLALAASDAERRDEMEMAKRLRGLESAIL